MTARSRHWRPSRALRQAERDLTAGHAMTRESVEAFSRKSPRRFWAAFWSKVDLDPTPGACWFWQGAQTTTGYGQIAVGTGKRKRLLAHRVAYVSMEGDLRAGVDLMHTCDESLCCNPGHLRRGDQRANMADMYRKGRNVLPPSARRTGGTR